MHGSLQVNPARNMIRIFVAAVATRMALCAGAVLTLVPSSFAQSVDGFYAGRTIDLTIGGGAGGGYDLLGRVLARYWSDHIPGKPTIIAKNLAGGASVIATNVIYNVKPRDGSAIGMIVRNILTMPLMGVESVKFDVTKLNWLGSVSNEASVCISRGSSAVKSWDDLLRHDLIVGVSAPGSDTYNNALMLRNIFGARFQPIGGYPDAKQIEIAFDRGEVDAMCGSWTSLKAQKPGSIRDSSVNFLIVVSDRRIDELPNVPSIFELARTEDIRSLLTVLLASQVAGRPFVAPPDMPADRLAALRSSFMETMKDERFVTDARRLGYDINPMSGDELTVLVNRIYSTPPDLVASAKRVIEKPLPFDQTLQPLK